MSIRLLGAGLLLATTLFTAGCASCCHKWGHGSTSSASPCCPPPAPPCCGPGGGPIAPPPGTISGSNYAPPIVSIPAR